MVYFDELVPVPFAIQSYQARSGLASKERVLNMYAELSPQESPSTIAIYLTPGATIWQAINNFNPIYGMIVMIDNLYIICGLNFYKIDSGGNSTLIGSMGTLPGRVMMTENGIQVTVLTESGISYYYDTNTNLFLQITDPNYQLSNSVTTLDGYTVFTKQDSQVFFISNNRATQTYQALNFASAEAESDNLTTVLNYNLQLVLIGTRSIEFWYDTGNATFPFQRIEGALIKVGTNAKYSAVSDLTGVFLLGSDKVVYQIINYQAQRISTHGVEKAIESYSVIDDAFAFVYIQEGHRFYCLTFPTEKKTWVYDITSTLWHERESINPNNMQVGSWLANCYANFDELQLIGDANTGTIYQLDLNNNAENGTPIIRELISATHFDTYRRDSNGRFVLYLDTGIGIDGSGQGTNPQIMMQTSRDGKTWSNELWQPLGPIGAYETEVWWDQVDWGRSLLLKINVSDPVNFTLLRAFLTRSFLSVDRGKS